jgi:4-amino-4-deoxy-L-arabinose transferase-like glycosyltransferase
MKKYILILLIILFAIALFKIWNAHPTFSDENVYFLLAKKIYEGYFPYKDFCFVHPPFQLFTLYIFFKIFGVSLTSGKLVSIIFSSLSVFALFLIGKKILRKNEAALVASLFFVFFPSFLIFSDQELGVWESIFFLLLSLLFILENHSLLPAFFFSISIFYRYLSLFFFPLLLYFSNDRKKFLIFSLIFTIVTFSLIFYLFGFNFFYQSIGYQFFNKLFMSHRGNKNYWQYLSLGVFALPILMMSFFTAYEKLDKKILIISLYSIFYELLLTVSLKTISYHYFLYSLPFLSFCFSYTFFTKKSLFVRISLVLLLFLSLLLNFKSIDFYLNKERAKYIEEITDYVSYNINNDKIWGEPSLVSYIAFSKNVSFVSDYLDPYVDYWRYLEEEKVIEVLKREKPKFIIDMNSYLITSPKFAEFINKYYVRDKIFEERKSRIFYSLYKSIY